MTYTDEELKDMLRQVNESLKQLSLDFDPISASSSVEEEDLEYVRNQIMKSLCVPKELLYPPIEVKYEVKCDCGAAKARTTHVDWCSLSGK